MKSASAASWLTKQPPQIDDTNEEKPVMFDLLKAEANAIDIANYPDSRNVRKLAAEIITICTGDDFIGVRQFASTILNVKDELARAYAAREIINLLNQKTNPAQETAPETAEA